MSETFIDCIDGAAITGVGEKAFRRCAPLAGVKVMKIRRKFFYIRQVVIDHAEEIRKLAGHKPHRNNKGVAYHRV